MSSYKIIFFVVLLLTSSLRADFSHVKTFFQTNVSYDPRVAFPTDGVIVHPHNERADLMTAMHDSWNVTDKPVGRMFFANSDDGNGYWTGRWDGQKHADEVETLADGTLQLCAGIRPYLTPTAGWTTYLKSKADLSIHNGIDAILPEEPLAHVFTGYEDTFKRAWVQHYHEPWQPESKNGYARYRTAALKGKLYLQLEKDLLEHTKKRASEQGRPIDFIIPIHSLYSNVSAGLVAPLGMSLDIDGIDGYIGQIWTGPVNWSLANYSADNKSFFMSAYALYDYFVQLTVGTPKKLWLLVDPVEDDPDHQWRQFEQWYKHCATAMLLMRDTDRYEILPWPERIFLPGHATGGGTPAPEDFRQLILSITQVLQEMPLGGQWLGEKKDYGIGVAVSDSVMWQRKEGAKLQGIYSMILPLLNAGVDVSSAVMERSQDVEYMNRFKVLVLSYEDWKPYRKQIHDGIVEWVRQGGVLVVLGTGGDELDAIQDFWWQNEGYASALDALLGQLEHGPETPAPQAFGKGWILRDKGAPAEFADAKRASSVYLPLIQQAVAKTGVRKFDPMPCFAMKRGDYVIAHPTQHEFRLEGTFIDIFDDNMAVIHNIHLQKGQSGIFRDISDKIKSDIPSVLQTTYRLMEHNYNEGQLRFTVKGPAGNHCIARVFTGNFSVKDIEAIAGQEHVKIHYNLENSTTTIKFPNHVEGVTVTVHSTKKVQS